ncbi:asparagine synthase-related protein [Allopusillimonas ginsengisoli]|uniref:asparagine synthase-related protein n=1 Tax=Allopusillimonas ginsengisoli TaxID=453575 RepID=UPI0039C07B63
MKNIVTNLTSGWQAAQSNAGQEVWVKGSPYVANQKQTAEMVAASLPHRFGVKQALEQTMLRYNGFYSLVCQQAGQLFAGVDRLRSLPLFYCLTNGRLCLSDNAEWVRQQAGDHTMDPVAREEFQLAGYVTGPDTLFPNVKQLQAGECLLASQGENGIDLKCHRYYRYLYTEPKQYDEAALLEELDQVTASSIQRLIDYAAGRQIVVPLSGGYDSRLIVSQLKRFGYDNVLTFTYGMAGNKEAQYSQQVAHSLKLKWHFVEYSRKSWTEAWRNEDRWAYQQWASNWTSVTHTQDWLAVKVMTQNGVLSPDAVFAPGHIARNDIPRWLMASQPATADLLGKTIFSQHCYLAPIHLESVRPMENWQERLVSLSEQSDVSAAEALMVGINKWDWQERQAKYIVNSMRVYEFFGYNWWMPLWDNEFTEYWEKVPFLLRKKRETYYDFVNHAYSEQAGMPHNRTLGNGRDVFFKKALLRLPFADTKLAETAWQKLHEVMLKTKQLDISAAESGIPEEDHKRLVRSGYTPIGARAHFFLKDAASYASNAATR